LNTASSLIRFFNIYRDDPDFIPVGSFLLFSARPEVVDDQTICPTTVQMEIDSSENAARRRLFFQQWKICRMSLARSSGHAPMPQPNRPKRPKVILAGLLQLAAFSFRTIKSWSGFGGDF
jgi:hypothetical protein